MLFVYNSTGTLLAFNDDAIGLDSQVTPIAPATGTYFVAVGGFNARPGRSVRPGERHWRP